MAALFVAARPGGLAGARTAAGMSQRDLEGEAGVSRSTISVLERVPGYGIEVDKASAVAAALGVHPGRLFMHKNGDPVAWEMTG
ncbi:helix-turn-helix domain-containing protein [Georgenia sp. MJ170]|uniref:helix-turn-helix domain-containing protein n=1 Tax=Georgenia sunbinii TaxID=3117728 RepID=UPI002F2634D2